MTLSSLLDYTLLVVVFSSVGTVVSLQNEIRIGARPSPLATVQAKAVISHLEKIHDSSIKMVLIPIQASGDIARSETASSVIQDVPLAFSNVDFTEALDQSVLDGTIDVAVHSLKDIRPDHRWHSGLSIHCPLPREDPADVLVGPYRTLAELPFGAKIGTSSIRRQAQLRHRCSDRDIQIVNLRGNVEARLDALRRGEVDALLLARSGLDRLKLDSGEIYCTSIPSTDMLPATCQGIVGAVVLENGIYDTDKFWEADQDATLMAHAERSFLNILDRSSPWKGRPPLAGQLARELSENNERGGWIFQGLLSRPDGDRVVTGETRMEKEVGTNVTTDMAEALGAQVGHGLLEKAGPDFFEGLSTSNK